MLTDFANTLPQPRPSNVRPIMAARAKPAPTPFPSTPYTRAVPDAELARRAQRLQAEGERTRKLLLSSWQAGLDAGIVQGYRKAMPVYFTTGILIGLALGAATILSR